MIRRLGKGNSRDRRGAACVELAVLSPFLALLFIWTFDFCRAYHAALVVSNCARNGAYFESTKSAPWNGPGTKKPMYTNMQQAALADWPSNLTPAPTISSTSEIEAGGVQYVKVQVTYPFHSVTGLMGAQNPVTIVRNVRMRVVN
jgi:Flp pilus assembly protein TadG